MEEKKYEYTVTLTGWAEQTLTYNSWDDVQNFIAYVVEGCKGNHIGFVVCMKEVKANG